MDLCSRMTILDVSEHTGLHWATVKAIDRKRLKRGLPKERDLKKLLYLGVDEVSVRRGHRYLTTVVDLPNRPGSPMWERVVEWKAWSRLSSG